jgi:hypothetical protein
MRESHVTIASFGLLLACTFTSLARAADLMIYVSPDGKDTWSGGLAKPNAEGTDGPVATLERARDILRQKRSAAGEARVIVGDGPYPLTQPFTLNPGDSGVTYEAAPGAQPVFSGGRTIRGFEQAENGLWRARVPEAASGQWRFEQLFVNGRRAVRARTPNKLYLSRASRASSCERRTCRPKPLPR